MATRSEELVPGQRTNRSPYTVPGVRRVVIQVAMGVLTFGAACSPFPAYSAVLGAVTTIGVVVALSSPRPFKLSSLWAIPIAAFAAWAVVSSSWSAVPSLTLRYALLFGGVSLFPLLAIQVMTVVEFLKPTLYGLRAFFMLSLLIALALPGVGRVGEGYEGGAIQGLAVSRNTLGWLSVFYLVIAVCFFLIVRNAGGLVLDSAIGLGCLWAAQAQTSLLAAVAVAMLLVVLRLISAFRPFAKASLLAIVSPVLVYFSFELSASLDSVAESLGRNATFTGRTEIWQAVGDEIARSPYYGYGWFGVWWEGLPITYRMWNSAGFAMYHAHNSYLELLLQIGYVGLALTGVILVVGVAGLLVAVVRGVHLGVSSWPVLIFLTLIVISFGESVIIELNGWYFFAMAYAGSAAAVHASMRTFGSST